MIFGTLPDMSVLVQNISTRLFKDNKSTRETPKSQRQHESAYTHTHTHTHSVKPVSYTHLDVYKRQTPIIFGEDRLRERGSLPVTIYVLTRVFPMANDNSRKFKQNQKIICIQP